MFRRSQSLKLYFILNIVRKLIRLTPFLKERIINLHTTCMNSGLNNVEIVTRMLHEENLKISRQKNISYITQTRPGNTLRILMVVKGQFSVQSFDCSRYFCLGPKIIGSQFLPKTQIVGTR